MRLRKDIITDIIYSIPISLVLIIGNVDFDRRELTYVEFFRSLIIVGLFFIWILLLSKKFQSSIFINDKKKSSALKDTLLIIKQSSEVKIAALILLYLITSIAKTGFNIDYLIIFLRSSQICIIVVFVLSVYSTVLLKGRKNIRLKLGALLLAPYFITMLTAYLFEQFTLEIFLLIPGNLYLMFLEDNISILQVTIYVVAAAFFSLNLFNNINKIKRSKVNLILPVDRMN